MTHRLESLIPAAKRSSAWTLILLVVVCTMAQVGCFGSPGDALLNVKLGGETTAFSADRNAFSHSARNLTNEQRRTFEVGDSFFEQNWVTAPASTDARDGLGPTFNAQSCSSCHVLDGRAEPPEDQDDPERGLLFRLSMPDPVGGDNPVPIPQYGEQLTARGLCAFEYIAFADADLDAPRCEYLVGISDAAAEDANAVVDEWQGTGTASGKEPYADEDPQDRLLGIGDLVAGASEEADIRVRETFDTAITSIDVLLTTGESLSWLITNERGAVMEGYVALKELQIALNTDVVSLLGISVGFADTDGDSG